MNIIQVPTISYSGDIMQLYVEIIAVYLVVLFIAYFVIRAAVKAGTKEQRKLSMITNILLEEQLRAQGVTEVRIKEISVIK